MMRIRQRPALATAAIAAAGVLLAAGPAAAQDIQPGLEAPQQQPGLSRSPAPPQVPAAVPITDLAVAPPPSPRPSQQVREQPETTSPTDTDSGASHTDHNSAPRPYVPPQPVAPVVNPRLVRFGTAEFVAPDGVPVEWVHASQSGSDAAEWWASYLFRLAGDNGESADHEAAATVAGGAAGVVVGAVLAQPIPSVVGCVTGAVVGAAAGTLAAGPAGTAAGGLFGCAGGWALAGGAAAVVGGVIGGAVGAGAGVALGADLDNKARPPAPANPPSPAPVKPVPAPDADHCGCWPVLPPLPVPAVPAPPGPDPVAVATGAVHGFVDQVSASSPLGAQAVSSVRAAVSGLPRLSCAQAGSLSGPVDAVVDAVQAAIGTGPAVK